MASGIWTAVSGAQAQAQVVDTVANNLANMDTNAFKKDVVTFKEYMAAIEREHLPTDIPRGPVKDQDFYPLDGADQKFVVVDGSYTNFKQGNLKVTQSTLDVAMDGPGFLEVSTPSGIRYTRQGSLKLATDGRLVTTEGYPVLAATPGGLATAQPATAVQPSQGGLATQGGVAAGPGAEVAAQVTSRMINLRDRNKLSIAPNGEIYSGDEIVAKINVVEFQDPNKVRKTGGQMFESKDPTNVGAAKKTLLRQGMLETSNVNPIEEMSNLIKANRMFEQDLKALKTYGDLMQREANDIGKL